jgi:hypothetical protein
MLNKRASRIATSLVGYDRVVGYALGPTMEKVDRG